MLDTPTNRTIEDSDKRFGKESPHSSRNIGLVLRDDGSLYDDIKEAIKQGRKVFIRKVSHARTN